ncbi:duplicated orphan permease [Terriglobus roseus]|uniref:Duplicated orphan permease n=1 Tax=Terriglobus roseus TaxID=392734 RepID=A0A1H4U8K0_9BACT|nr:duplicated orphan permease [Terriglobus roseus]
MEGESYTVIGILPAGFQFAPRGRLGVISPIQPFDGICEDRRSCHSLNGVARMLPGVTIAQADADVKRIATLLQAQYPETNRGQGGVAKPLSEEVIGKIRPVLYTLLTAALLLCAIACINVAGLLLARSESRRREFALRAALGATQARMLRQFTVESGMLVVTGLVLGIAAAGGAIRLLMLLLPDQMRSRMPFFDAVGLSAHTILFACAEAVVAALLFALVPALRLSLKSLQRNMAEGSAGAGSLSWRRLGSMLVMVEIATAVVLLVGAGMLARSLINLLHTDLAFDPAHLVTLSVGIPAKIYPTDVAQLAIERRVMDELRALPGVTAGGFGSVLPVSFNGNTDWIRFPGRPYDRTHIEINARSASPEYFQTLRVPLLHGRFFNDDDNAGKPLVAIVNRRFAEVYFPGENPLGKTFGDTSLSPKSIKTIVGVVDNLHEAALDDEMWPAAYYAAYQSIDAPAIALRVSGDERAVLESAARTVHSISPDLVASDIMTMTDHIESSQSAILHRGAAWLSGAFALLALLLCGVGLYGVVSYSVSLRTREIGVRMALGAPRKRIYALVLTEAGKLSLAGTAIGIALALLSATLLRGILFHVARFDVATLAVVSMLLALCSLGACMIPARRAALANPTDALRAD